jgi:hypothetical protein
MNSHIGFQARVYDYEQTAQDVLRPADANEEQGEMDVVEASAEAEIEVKIVEEPEKSGNVGLDADQIRKNGVALNGELVVFKDEEETNGEGGRSPRRDWVTYMDDV